MNISSSHGQINGYKIELNGVEVDHLLEDIGDVPSKQAGPLLLMLYRELLALRNLRGASDKCERSRELERRTPLGRARR